MIWDLETIHNIGVLLRNPKNANSLNGFFCDCSHCWTILQLMSHVDIINGLEPLDNVVIAARGD